MWKDAGEREGPGQQHRRSPQRDKVSSFTPPIALKGPEPQGPGVREQGWSRRGRVAPGTVTHAFHSGHRSLQWPPAAPEPLHRHPCSPPHRGAAHTWLVQGGAGGAAREVTVLPGEAPAEAGPGAVATRQAKSPRRSARRARGGPRPLLGSQRRALRLPECGPQALGCDGPQALGRDLCSRRPQSPQQTAPGQKNAVTRGNRLKGNAPASV